MWKPLLAAALMVLLPADRGVAAPPPAPAPAEAQYRLDVGDQVRVKVFEWRSTVGDVHEWTALNADFEVGADGTLSLPLLGAVMASGATVEELADAISTRLQAGVGLATKPQASVEVIQYRPFYILGDVNKPGEYPYRPGLTVLQAISIAGGLYRVQDAALVLTTSGELRVHRLQYNGLLARKARLQAELDGANTIAFPPELQSQNDATVAQLIQREQALFTARREALRSQIDAYNQLKDLLNGEVTSLQAKAKNVDQELVIMKAELDNTSTMVKQGLAIAPREYSLRETHLETEGRRLDLDTAMLRAREDIGKADQAILELRNKTRNEAQLELAEAEQKLPELAARIGAGTMIVDRQIGADGGQAADLASPLCLILRPSGGTTTTIRADETARVLPGDTLKILRAGETATAPVAAAAPAKPDGLAERSAPPTERALVPGGATQARSNAPRGQSRP